MKKVEDGLNKSGLGAIVLFDFDNIKYVTGSKVGEWTRDKMQRYAIYPRGSEPILFEIGSRVEAALKPWGAT